ncbi:hypothetical protein CDCA_CDCA01G0403 [Cyanidium caldarium]|uniref:Uncharacterized protein n=1 Tax=Cyanidium caldarium TaxID=2771 RepID=A0AAV9IR31_CYACA|nr:hypothetical protein CDCA_CDCA01G0403 [Cyanidium caldarium]
MTEVTEGTTTRPAIVSREQLLARRLREAQLLAAESYQESERKNTAARVLHDPSLLHLLLSERLSGWGELPFCHCTECRAQWMQAVAERSEAGDSAADVGDVDSALRLSELRRDLLEALAICRVHPEEEGGEASARLGGSEFAGSLPAVQLERNDTPAALLNVPAEAAMEEEMLPLEMATAEALFPQVDMGENDGTEAPTDASDAMAGDMPHRPTPTSPHRPDGRPAR